MGGSAEKLKSEFRIERDAREDAPKKNFEDKFRANAGLKQREKNPKNGPFTRDSGDFRDIRKTYQMLNENEKGESLRKIQKHARSGLSSEHYSKWE